MESVSTNSSSNLFDSHPLPHQQFSSRIAFANKSNSVTKLKLNSLSNKKSSRLPPIARCDSICSPPISDQLIRYFNRSADSSKSSDGIETNDFDPNIRVKQLERNIKFIKEDCQHLLELLHGEVEDLKVKNRDLQFQLITNGSFTPQFTNTLTEEQFVLMPLIRDALEPQIGEYVIRLETEVKRLRIALGETLKTNHLLKEELQKRKDRKQTADESNNKALSSPTVREFNKTFEKINKFHNSNQMENAFNLPRIANTVLKNN